MQQRFGQLNDLLFGSTQLLDGYRQVNFTEDLSALSLIELFHWIKPAFV